MTARVPVLVVGAGISGLVCAYGLRQAGVDVQILEASEQAGGVIRSERRDGYLLEYGPQSFNATAPVLKLCRELHLEDHLVAAPAGAPRFVYVNGGLRAVPLSPPAFLASSLFSAGTKLGLLRDVLGRSAPPAGDESVAAFVRRKFSNELLEKLVGPFVSGIYAGDPELLSVRSAFPQLYEAERNKGSVIRGLLSGGKKSDEHRERPKLQTFRDGNQTLIAALVNNLAAALRRGATVQSIRPGTLATKALAFEVTIASNGGTESLVTDQLILATPTLQAADLLRDIDSQFATTLKKVSYAPVAVVSLGYSKGTIRQDLNGFGFLVPRSAGLRILGTVWNSSLFPGRAPEGHALLTSFIGGATDTNITALSDAAIAAIVAEELAAVLGISQQPTFSQVQMWPRAIPQYNIGHSTLLDELDTLHRRHPKVFLAGNYLRGSALGACVEQSLATALTAARQAGTT